MKKIVSVLLAVVFMIGCANKVWLIPPGRTQMDFERDKAECLYEARIYTPPSRAYVPSAPRDRYGISGAIATGLAQGIEEGVRVANLFGMCMRARGYYLVDKPQPIPVSDVSNSPEKTPPQTPYTPTPQYQLSSEPDYDLWHRSLSPEKRKQLADEYPIAKKENGNLTWPEFLKGKFEGRPGQGYGYHWEKDEKGNPVYVPHGSGDFLRGENRESTQTPQVTEPVVKPMVAIPAPPVVEQRPPKEEGPITSREEAAAKRGEAVAKREAEVAKREAEVAKREGAKQEELFITGSSLSARYYHRHNCDQARGLITKMTREQAEAKGLKPCPICKP